MNRQRLVTLGCRGRDASGKEVLDVPAGVVVDLHRYPEPGSTIIGSVVYCHFNGGGHGQRCKASHPDQDKVGDGVICPFGFDHPYVTRGNPSWKPPQEIAKALEELIALPVPT